MTGFDPERRDLKDRVVHEFMVYWVYVIYLALVFSAFTQYRRLLLAAHDISYTNYGVAVIEALILAKVIMIGDAVRLGRGLEAKPLIYPALYKTVVFTVFVGVFTVVEHMLKGLWRGKGLMGGLDDFLRQGADQILANSLIVFAAFVPFFAVKELGRVLGQDRIMALFFRKGPEQGGPEAT